MDRQSIKSTQNHRMFHSQNLMFQAKPKPMVGKFESEVIMTSSTVHCLTKGFGLRRGIWRGISLISFQEMKDPMFSSV